MKNSLVIFYVDDDADDLKIMVKAGESKGYEVTTFSSGVELLKELYQSSRKPDIIFLDEYMPIMTGTDVLGEIKKTEHLRDIPAIIFTGSSQHYLIDSYLESGANHIIEKPTSIEAYQDILDDVANIEWSKYRPNEQDLNTD